MTRTTHTDGEREGTDGVTRRSLTRTVLSSGAVVLAPSFVSVARGATDSGEVELSTTSTVPTDTNIDVRVFEDMDADGTADNQDSASLSGGSETFELMGLGGGESMGVVYWMDITLTTDDTSTTPSLDSATITLPEEPSTPVQTQTPVGNRERQGIDALWDNFLVFVTIAVGAMGALAGLASRSAALGAFMAYMTFAYLAVTTRDPLLTNILYVTLVLIIIGMAFKLWRLEFGGSS